MTQAKGWVTRQREQFELFASRSEHQEQRVQEIQASPPVHEKEFQVTPVVQEKETSICHKPTQAVDTQKAEVIVYI